MVEFAATAEGVAVMDRDAVEMVTDVDLDVPSQVAVIKAVPVVDPGLRVTVATPSELVVAVD